MTEQERISLLREQLHAHNHRYYVENNPVISDQDFDFMMHELQDLESRHPEMYDPNSPTMRVGSDLNYAQGNQKKSFGKVRHTYPMLSLANTYNREDIQEWYNQVTRGLDGESFEVCCEMKYDGLSISLIYIDGKLSTAVTRGDGEYGDDVTENIRTIKSIPLVLGNGDYPKKFEVRGEILLPWKEFERLNKEAEERGQAKFANPRNAASGTLKSLDTKVVAERRLDAYLYYLLGDEELTCSHYDNIMICASWGFKMTQGIKVASSLDEVMEYIAYWDTERKNLPVATDGIVLKVNSLEQQKKLGYTAKSPRWAIAYKYKADRVRTRLKSVAYQVGKTGAITPVANMEPVLIAGTIVKRASLYNEDMIQALDLHIGDYVYVEKGGEIIPKVVGVDYNSRKVDSEPIRFITNCPVCGKPLYRENNLSVNYCQNDANCHIQVKGHIEQFVSRKAMNIKGLGEEDISNLYDYGLIKDVADIYDLDQEKLLTLKDIVKNFGSQKAKNIVDSIKESKKATFEQVIYALGIRFIGENSAKLLARHFKSMDALRNASIEELLEIEGIGAVMAVSVHNFFNNPQMAAIVDRLKKQGLNMSISINSSIESVSTILAGQSIVISGVFQRHSREEYKTMIEEHGGKNVGSISSKTSFILAGENMGPSKLQKANQLGVTIMNEEDFLSLISKNVQ